MLVVIVAMSVVDKCPEVFCVDNDWTRWGFDFHAAYATLVAFVISS